MRLKRYSVELHTWYEWHSEESYTELLTCETPKGEWVKACEAIKLQKQIVRMQARINRLEGRA